MNDQDHVELIRFRDHVTEVLRLRDEQLKLQAKEYERRMKLEME